MTPAQNALQFAPSDSPTSIPFAEQSTSSSRMTVPFYLPPQQSTSNQAYAIHPYAYHTQPYATSSSPAIHVHPTNAPLPVAPSRRTSPTSPASSLSLPSPGARAPRSVPLHRGEACLHCRKRKMRCDAVKPACGPCMSNGKECEYEISPYLRQIQQLQDEAVMLRARIAELEGRSPPSVASSVSVSPLSPSRTSISSLSRPRRQQRISTHIRTPEDTRHTLNNSETTFGEHVSLSLSRSLLHDIPSCFMQLTPHAACSNPQYLIISQIPAPTVSLDTIRTFPSPSRSSCNQTHYADVVHVCPYYLSGPRRRSAPSHKPIF
ncbi:hypothetical protein BKA62DRAFT_380733 [Auriculariales sp. MPI-PUGE-AT-0066]|nr:hypothetical protein BKA62DRAFT_380733 [Auriculariales sp. MPI-PUGE-AT-0066]